jgi:hypothetical protein
MGGILSVLETWIWGDLYWIETGLQKGYFPRGKQWEMHHVAHIHHLLTNSTTVVRLSAISLVGQGPSLLKEDVGKTLLAILVARPELEVLRVPVLNRQHNDALHAWVTAHRPKPTSSGGTYNGHRFKKLRLECYYVGDGSSKSNNNSTNYEDEETQYWRDLTQLPSHNVLAVAAEK